MKYRIEAMHSGYAIEATSATDDEIANGAAFWSPISGWETYEDAASELARLSA